MIKEMISEMNRAMYNGEMSFECAKNLLKQLSKITGKDYDILNNKRVVYWEYNECHDAWVNA